MTAPRAAQKKMIQFSLKCGNDHRFDSWFQSSAAFDKLAQAGMVTCAVCGATSVSKAVMAPRIAQGRAGAADSAAVTAKPAPAQMLEALRAHVEAHADYVGTGFAAQARAMHDGSAPERPIYGEARVDEAKSLIEDGIPIAPLPFIPRRKTH